MPGPFEEFLKQQQGGQSQDGPFSAFLAEQQKQQQPSPAALLPGAEKTGLPGIQLRNPILEAKQPESRSMGEQLLGGPKTLVENMGAGAIGSVAGLASAIEAMLTEPEQRSAVRQAVPQLSALSALGQTPVVGEALRKGARKVADTLTRYSETPPAAGAENKSFVDDPSLLYQPDYVLRLLGQGVGSSVPMMATGGGAAAGAAARLPWLQRLAVESPRLAKGAEALAGVAGSSVIETLADAGMAFEQAVRSGVPAARAAELFAETMHRELPATVAGNVFNPALGGRWNSLLSPLLGGGGEVLQGVAQRSAENAVLGNPKPLLEGAAEEALGGALVDTVLGGAVQLAGRRQSPRVTLRNPEAEAAAAASETIPAGPETISAEPETKGSPAETISGKSEPAMPFTEFLRRDAETQAALQDADEQIAEIEPEAFAAGQKADAQTANPFEGLSEPDAQIRAAAWEAGQRKAVADAGVQEDRSAPGEVDRSPDPVPVLPEAADAGVSGSERPGVQGDVERVPDVREGDGDSAGAPAPLPVRLRNPEAERANAMEVEQRQQQNRKQVRQDGAQARPFAEAVKQHGRWEIILRQAVEDGNEKRAAAAGRMVDKYGAAIRAEVPDYLPVMADEIRDEIELSKKPAAKEAAPVVEQPKPVQEKLAAPAPAKPVARKRSGGTAAPGAAASARAPEQAAAPATPAAEGGLKERIKTARRQQPASKSKMEDTPETWRWQSALATGGKSVAIRDRARVLIDGKVMRTLREIAADGHPVTTVKLREALPGMSADALHEAVARLYRRDDVHVNEHSHPKLLPMAERDALIYDREKDRYWVSVSPNMERQALRDIAKPPTKKNGEKGAAPLDLLLFGQGERIAKAMETAKTRTADAYAVIAKPLASRIADEGNGAGRRLMSLLGQTRDRGEVAAGQVLAQLEDLKLSKLTKAERFQLLDALEGRKPPASDRVREAFEGVRELTDAIADVAEGLQVQVKQGIGKPRKQFQRRANYFPHVIRDVEALKSGRVREDVIENVVHIGAAPDAKAAGQMLDEYIGFVESDKRLGKLLDYLVASGQARNQADALAKMERMKARTKRQGTLEYSREVNLPFYDPDPARVLAPVMASQAIRLTQIAMFGQDDQLINREILAIQKAGGNSKLVREGVDRMLGRAMEADDAAARVSRFVRAVQSAKLGLAVIPNSFQGVMNSLVAADAPTVLLGLKRAVTSEGRRFAIQSGAAIEPVLSEAHRDLGGSELITTYLKATGFSATEQWNRTLAANVGKAYAEKMLAKAKKGDTRGTRLLNELLGKKAAAAALTRGSLQESDVLIAAKRFSDMTQFRARSEDMPGWASTPLGKVFFQFKSFAYNQARLMHRETVTALRNGETTRGLRTLFVLATVFPLQGEVVRLLREAIRGGEPKEYESALAHYWDALAASGALGMLGEVLQASGWKRGLEFVAGPTASHAGDTMNLVGALADPDASDEAKEKAIQRYLRRHLPMGQLLGRVFEE